MWNLFSHYNLERRIVAEKKRSYSQSVPPLQFWRHLGNKRNNNIKSCIASDRQNSVTGQQPHTTTRTTYKDSPFALMAMTTTNSGELEKKKELDPQPKGSSSRLLLHSNNSPGGVGTCAERGYLFSDLDSFPTHKTRQFPFPFSLSYIPFMFCLSLSFFPHSDKVTREMGTRCLLLLTGTRRNRGEICHSSQYTTRKRDIKKRSVAKAIFKIQTTISDPTNWNQFLFFFFSFSSFESKTHT